MGVLLIEQGHIIRTFSQLQRYFSPAELYAQIDLFRAFAGTHSLVMPLQIQRGGVEAPAVFYTKRYWMRILNGRYEIFKIPSAQNVRMYEEYAAAGIGEKYAYILQCLTGKRPDAPDLSDGLKKQTLTLLAISELSEMDALKVPPEAWRAVMEKEDAAQPFLYEKAARLKAGAGSLRFPVYEGDTLQANERIRVVPVRAVKGEIEYARTLKIGLYGADGTCAGSVQMKVGEFRYCTAVGGHIIEFLPTEDRRHADLQICRPDLGSGRIEIMENGGETVSFGEAEGGAGSGVSVSSFSSGGSSRGYLLVWGGELYCGGYKDRKLTRRKYDAAGALDRGVIDAVVTEDGYEILLEDGRVLSDCPGRERRAVSLRRGKDQKAGRREEGANG